MREHKALKILKLPECVVSRAHCLVTLVATYSNSNIGLGDHAHIVGSITNSQGDLGRLILLNQSDDLSLLLWRKPARDEHLARESDLHKTFCQPPALLDFEETIALYHCSIVQFG